MSRLTLLLLLLAAAAALPARAAEFDRGDLRLELSGELRSVFTFTRDLDPERLFLEGSTRRRDAGLSLTRARAAAQAVWKDRVYAEVVYDHEVYTGSGLRGLSYRVAQAIGTQTWLDADRVYSRHRDAEWRHALYRAWVRFESERFELTLGRQRIPLGVGRLWNPVDLFNPIFPLAIEGDQRIGQDAIRARFRLVRGLWLEGIWSPQDDPDEHRGAVRLAFSRTTADAALMVGRFRRDWVFGADFTADVKGATVRAEATYTDLETGGRIWQVVSGVDYTFSVGSGLYALVEHLYNENRVDAETFARLPPGLSPDEGVRLVAAVESRFFDRITTLGRNQTAFDLGYDLTPLLRLDLAWLYDWHGPSVAFVPSLSWSAKDNLEVALSGQLFYGRHARTEYGDRPAILILRVNAFF